MHKHFILLIVLLSPTITFTMESEGPLPFDKDNGRSGILIEKIMFNNFLFFFTPEDTPNTVRNHIMSMSLVNKKFYQFAQGPYITRCIINKVWDKDQHIQAKRIKTKSAEKYFQKTDTLMKYGCNINTKRIRNLFNQGADLNVSPSATLSALCNIQKHANPQTKYANIKCMLELGANPDIGCAKGQTPLLTAIYAHDIPIIKLLLSYNPKYKQLNLITKMCTANQINQIAQGKLLCTRELNQCLAAARNYNSKLKMDTLIRNGAQPEAISFLHELTQKCGFYIDIDAICAIINMHFKNQIVANIMYTDYLLPITTQPLLFLAAGNIFLTSELLRLGLDPCFSYNGKTALECNVQRRHHLCVPCFFGYVSNTGYLYHAIETDNPAAIQPFCSHNYLSKAELATGLYYAIIHQKEILFRLLLQYVTDRTAKIAALNLAIEFCRQNRIKSSQTNNKKMNSIIITLCNDLQLNSRNFMKRINS